MKKVLGLYDQDAVLENIKKYLSVNIDNPEKSLKRLVNMWFTFVHFNYYDKWSTHCFYEPAEYAVCQWTMENGIMIRHGSIIDTGNEGKEVVRRIPFLTVFKYF
jgi:hypothetical protein